MAFLKLLLLTGIRKEEAMQAQWVYVDLERGTLFLPETKSGRGRHVGCSICPVLPLFRSRTFSLVCSCDNKI